MCWKPAPNMIGNDDGRGSNMLCGDNSHWEQDLWICDALRVPEELVNIIITENSFVILLAFPVDDLITWTRRGPSPCRELYRSQLRWPAPGLEDNDWAIETTRNEEHRAARQAADEISMKWDKSCWISISRRICLPALELYDVWGRRWIVRKTLFGLCSEYSALFEETTDFEGM